MADEVTKLSRANTDLRAQELSAGEARQLAVNCDSKLEHLINVSAARVKAEAAEAETVYAWAKWTAIVVAAALVVGGLGLTFLVTASITRPLARGAELAGAIAKGDL